MDKRIDAFQFSIMESADLLSFEVEGAMIAVRDKVTGICSVIYLDHRDKPQPTKNRKGKKHGK